MQPLTVHALSAWHALCHRSALTRAERCAVDAHPAPLTPQRWRETTRRLDAAGDGIDLELAFLWCGLEPTPESTRRVAEALAHDRARLGALARALKGHAGALTGAEAQLVRAARCDLATERALRIACTAPLDEADACGRCPRAGARDRPAPEPRPRARVRAAAGSLPQPTRRCHPARRRAHRAPRAGARRAGQGECARLRRRARALDAEVHHPRYDAPPP